MSKKLIRILSTGRTGTRFLSALFRDLGFNAYHEDFYAGEPSVAIHAYTNFLGDMWIEDPQHYFEFQSPFADVYLRTLADQFEQPKEQKSFWKKPSRTKYPNVVVECGHNLTLATPLIHNQLHKLDVDPRYFILFRNPLHTIHALFKAEGKQNYPFRPSKFHTQSGFLGAAQVWRNAYLHMLDLSKELNPENFYLLDLALFTQELVSARKAFAFAGIEFDQQHFIEFRSRFEQEPIRTSKTESIRNSDLYRDLEFVFDEDQIAEVSVLIADVLEKLSIDSERMADEYREFHKNKKTHKLAKVSDGS